MKEAKTAVSQLQITAVNFLSKEKMVMYVDNRKTACLVYWRASDMTGHCNLLHEKRLV